MTARAAFGAALLLLGAHALPAPLPAPPNIPDGSLARMLLDSLVVAESLSGDGYDRDLFDHWNTYAGSCNTREYVLQRDGRNVVTNSRCQSESGEWYSPFDGETWYQASDVDIDHMVPLKNAWISGASQWPNSQREAFANDVDRPQLWAVTDNVNQEKGASSPDEWRPPLRSFHCTYAKSWVDVKAFYDLTITPAERDALEEMLDLCDDGGGSDEQSDDDDDDDDDAAGSVRGSGRTVGALVFGLAVWFAL